MRLRLARTLAKVKERHSEPRLLSSSYPWWKLGVAALAVLVVIIIATGIGSVHIPTPKVLEIVLSKFTHTVNLDETWNVIIWQIRLPRVVMAALVGMALAASGATYQGLFRNPLADPYLIGVASGAGLGATVVMVSGISPYVHGFSLVPIAAFAGALLSVTFAYLISRHPGGLSKTTIILAGVAIASLTSSAAGFLMIRANPDIRPLLAWLMGGFVGTHWTEVGILLPYLIFGSLGMMVYGRILNVMQLGEEEASHLGVNVERTKLILIVLASLVTAAAVSVSGLIGFVGLVAPHVVRLIWGHDYRFLLPMSMLMGAGFLVAADIVARTVVTPSELPVGLVTAFCGAPFFLYLLYRTRRTAL